MSPKTTIFTQFYSFWQVFMCFLMYSYELHQVTVKKFLENAALAFYDAFYAEKWPKYKEIPLFSQKSRYLKNTFLDTSLARKFLKV